MIEQQTDILIVGGGLTGAALMCALKAIGYDALLIDRQPLSVARIAEFDVRSLALSPASQRILTMLGLWDSMATAASPIHSIHISDQYRFGTARLHGSVQDPLGYVVELQVINQVLQQALDKDKIIAPATLTELDSKDSLAIVQTAQGVRRIKATLIVAADGVASSVRQLSHLPVEISTFNQDAIVSNIGLATPHQGRAYERFTAEGPLALLPMQGNKMSLVWAMAPHRAQQFMTLDESSFLKELQQAFGYRLGRLIKVGKRVRFPLQQAIMPIQAQWPLVFLGNAAHTLHPVAGQGFNLGLRDVAALAQAISQYGLRKEMLTHYVSLRVQDQHNIIRFTNGLIRLFTSKIPGMGVARDLGLILLDNSTFLKRCFSRYAQGYSGIIPDLICGIALEKKEDNESRF